MINNAQAETIGISGIVQARGGTAEISGQWTVVSGQRIRNAEGPLAPQRSRDCNPKSSHRARHSAISARDNPSLAEGPHTLRAENANLSHQNSHLDPENELLTTENASLNAEKLSQNTEL